ncbi:MAG: nitronate monooxygenase [Gemmatimonadales bacterium]|nr:nitronate monooxygenase [Gemmatimonadales bacterium]
MPPSSILPPIIQGGMGVGVSGWPLARAVSLAGQLGVVSGTALDTLLVRRLQDGDPGGHLRRAMAAFPIPGIAEQVLHRFFHPEGRRPDQPYRLLSIYNHATRPERALVTVLAGFVEVFLAKEGHDRPIGMNLLTKVQLPNLALLYGAMLAGIDVVLMGAGIPREIPGALDKLARHEPASLKLEITGQPPEGADRVTLDPTVFWSTVPAPLNRPQFLAIIASNSLATMLARKSTGRVDGFVIEGPLAGGHNAPPRGEPRFNQRGEPIYGDRDAVDLAGIAALGLPFWVAGGVGRPGGLAAARQAGAAGIQVGTLFAYCDESGLAPELKREVLAGAVAGQLDVVTDPRASPTGYPFKVVHRHGDPDVTALRHRICDLGGLRAMYVTAEGRIGYRCSAEPIEQYVAKGGTPEDAEGRQCLCNGLTAAVGLGQVREDGTVEPPIVTSGDELLTIATFLGGRETYRAADVIDWLLA